jgi:hypothetical protein
LRILYDLLHISNLFEALVSEAGKKYNQFLSVKIERNMKGVL